MNHYATSMYCDKSGRHYWFAKELKKRGHEVTIFCATTFLNDERQIDTQGKLLSVKRTEGIPFIFVNIETIMGKRVGNEDSICNNCRRNNGLFSAAY